MKFFYYALTLAVAACAPGLSAAADAYPSQPIKIIVPFPPGSGADTSARFFGDQLSKSLKQSVVIENRAGANGVIAVEYAKRAPADGYTLLMGTNSVLSVNPFVLKNLPYDALNDFKPISGLTKSMMAVVVGANSKYKTVAELVAAAKTPPGIKVGTFSAGYRIAQAWLASSANVTFLDIPYAGVGQVLTGLLAGDLDFSIVDMSSAKSMIEGGKLRALAVTGEQRNADLPSVPTLIESGYRDYVNYTWNGYYAPKQTPDAIIETLSKAMQGIVKSQAAEAYAKGIQGEVLALDPVGLRKFHANELDRLRKVAVQTGIKPE